MSKKVKLLAIGVSLIIFGSIGAGFYIMLNKLSKLDMVVQSVLPEEEEEAAEEGEEDEKAGKAIGQIFPLDSFVVNLADERSKFIRVSMSLEYKPEVDPDKIEERLPQIKDAILTYIPTKTSDELRNIDGKNELRVNIMSQINGFLGDEIITNIYFTEFVIQ